MAHSSLGTAPAHSPAGSNRVRAALIMLAGGAALSLALFLHRVSWWPAPFAISLSHTALGAAAMLVVAFIARRARRGTRSEELVNASGGTLIRRGTAYDWLVRILLMGRERRFRNEIVDLGAVKPGEAVLDVGCGTGTLLMAVADRVGSVGPLRGIEPSPEMLARARQKAGGRYLDMGLTQASADALPFPAGSFDVVFCTLVLHHLPPQVQATALSEMRRVLRPGGRIVIADLSAGSPISLVGLLHGIGTGASGPLQEAAARLRAADFESVSTHRTRSQAVGCVVARLPASD